MRISCCVCRIWYTWWRRQYFQSSKTFYFILRVIYWWWLPIKELYIFNCCTNVTYPNITYLQLLSCDKNKEFFGNLFLAWIEEFPWLMFWMIALIKEFDNIYMNFLTSPKIKYSSEVIFTLCDVRKIDLNSFNIKEVMIIYRMWEQKKSSIYDFHFSVIYLVTSTYLFKKLRVKDDKLTYIL